MAQTAYIHIPFCAHKCDFCDFAAFAGVDQMADEYCQVLIQEIRTRLQGLPRPRLSSLFFGGGTPGYVPPSQIEAIILTLKELTDFSDDIEISLETTPQSITAEKAAQWLSFGVNRLSIGVQSFNDNELLAMGRDHNSMQALAGVRAAREGGFTNIGIDLMFGLPEQTEESWQKTLETAMAQPITHLSAYGLTIAGNSPLLVRYPLNSSAYPDEEAFTQMYARLVSAAAEAGLTQYEISNFSKPGLESRHNLAYWVNQEYFAFGVGAHRYIDGVRSSNLRSLKRYMADSLASETHEVIDDKMRRTEAILLGLRLNKGIDLLDFKQRYGVDIAEEFRPAIVRLAEGGFISIGNNRLKLSQEGILVSNTVIAEFV